MEKTQYPETEALLMVMDNRSHEVPDYLRDHFSARELRRFVDQLDRLAGLCEVVEAEAGDVNP